MNKFKNTSFIFVGLLLLNSCNKYLDVNPDNRVDLDTPQKAAQLLTNAYSNAGYNFTDWMTNNVEYTPGTQKLPEQEQMFAWDDVTTSVNQDTPTFYWTATYDAIAHANEVLNVIDKLEGDQARKDAAKAEAYLTRAYGHFMLVNLFAEHYSDRADRRDGIPYIEKPETEFIVKYDRNTIEEVYDKVESDLLEGLELVDDSFYANSGKYHFTRNAALAFASRFYLFKGEYTKCIEYSSLLLGANPTIFIKDIKALLAEYSEPQDFLSLYCSPTDQSNLLLVRQVTNANANLGYWPSPSLGRSIFNDNPFNADDIRIDNRYPIFVRGNNFWGFGKFEFLFERSSLTSNVGFNYTIMPVFRGEEVLLNRAEAYVYENNISAAMADLQVMVNKRYEGNPTITITLLRSAYGLSNNQQAATEYIIRERRKEFIHEGLWWFDIKRFQIPITHTLVDGSTVNLTANDKRKALQIPQAAIDIGGLAPNPR